MDLPSRANSAGCTHSMTSHISGSQRCSIVAGSDSIAIRLSHGNSRFAESEPFMHLNSEHVNVPSHKARTSARCFSSTDASVGDVVRSQTSELQTISFTADSTWDRAKCENCTTNEHQQTFTPTKSPCMHPWRRTRRRTHTFGGRYSRVSRRTHTSCCYRCCCRQETQRRQRPYIACHTTAREKTIRRTACSSRCTKSLTTPAVQGVIH